MIIIDNYDSFTYNIVEYFKILGVDPLIFKNDEITIADLKRLNFKSIIISPGWGNPDNSGISMDIIKEFHNTKKILGICLGHQCICKYFGGKIKKAEKPMHGKLSLIEIKEQNKLFKGIPSKFNAVRYHSLIVDKSALPECLKITGVSEKQEIMSIRHKQFPIFGIQFHPEAILTEYGMDILKNFLLL